jgi:hypothetical protein
VSVGAHNHFDQVQVLGVIVDAQVLMTLFAKWSGPPGGRVVIIVMEVRILCDIGYRTWSTKVLGLIGFSM